MLYTFLLVTAYFGAVSHANVIPRQASYTTDPTLPNQTIYLPTTIPSTLKLPVIVYGVGGCSDSGTNTAFFHNELASHGFMVIVNNGPTSRAQTNASSLTAAADFVFKVAGTGKYANVDKTRMAVSGWSCGGLQAYTAGVDARFSTIGIFSSGQFAAADSEKVASKVTKPIFYFLGGSSDIAYTNGERDYTFLPKTTPAWKGNDNTGHAHTGTSGTFTAPSILKAAVKWAQWTLRGDASAATFFTSNAEATAAGWSGIASQSLDKLSVAPI
ncbi:hypothetical protein CC86DRAFT_448108 [Ophiobolus disseminans]|uniref:PET hydrolase/cutinase-like domain-containing protein n=1 Tax=Ophiobolus disseminans TaxID=1469910 RepID=A0A6A6ZPM7_9PLEO|nr:hypothetical protein CC86DRAFT_448108 [Ophiobolus disseminans]